MAKNPNNLKNLYNVPESATESPIDVDVRVAVMQDVRRNRVTITYDSTEPADQVVDYVQYARDLAISARQITAVRIVEHRVIVMRPAITR